MEQGKEKSAPPVYQPKHPYPAKKELLTNKRKLEDVLSVTFSEECSALITNSLPKKEKDPRGFIIPFMTGGLIDKKALTDLGKSINLMPYKIFQKLGLEELKPTLMTLQLADSSIKQPHGIIEDALLKVDKFIFPVDFVILDINNIVEVPLILGKPFLAACKALIDVKDGRMAL
ncbi:uncharacterized protein LOC120255420 [Dioscorea cayenensis subsp. rotundata]|uniref:Uncharacterized protein LOC120255420 n=1 Tax=Dioscorea cayennensis subsp. rotundata TaxID=55577 RepID=A0AB40AW56_DIOCR|nr:uncharacterized protein LOC120255420 [Dioscorea cayenensis subsp. rotundata]